MEIIADLELLALAMLKQFYRSTGGVKPARIIFYRDGVSEGQFKQVMVSGRGTVISGMDLELPR